MTRALTMAGATVLAAAAFIVLTAAAPANAAINDTCGGNAADYTGLAGLDTAFTGHTTDPGGTDDALTVTPVVVDANIFKAEIATGASSDQATTNSFSDEEDSTGRGTVVFSTPNGIAVSNNVSCTTLLDPTRVNTITGTIDTGTSNGEKFTITRS